MTGGVPTSTRRRSRMHWDDMADTPLDDFWEASSLNTISISEFGYRVRSYVPSDLRVSSLSSAGSPIPLKRVDDRLQRVFEKRVSGRTFSEKALKHRELEYLLASVGSDERGRSLVPSAGGMESVHTFAVCMNVDGPANQRVVRYDRSTHSMFLHGPSPSVEELFSNFNLECEGTPQVVVVFVIDPSELRRKYAERAGRFMLQEVGHASQNLSLRLAERRLTGYVLGGTLDRDVLDLLGVRHTGALIGGAIACGW
jgi:SagB-type dehydrogenase family enzyme